MCTGLVHRPVTELLMYRVMLGNCLLSHHCYNSSVNRQIHIVLQQTCDFEHVLSIFFVRFSAIVNVDQNLLHKLTETKVALKLYSVSLRNCFRMFYCTLQTFFMCILP